jgi:lipopolysaccharide transport system ATP-binding protein
MNQVAKGGRTVLFVSHNMAAIQSLCSKAIFLEKGRIRQAGDLDDVLKNYMSSIHDRGSDAHSAGASLGPSLKLRTITFGEGGIVSGEGATFRLEFQVLRPDTLQQAALIIFSDAGERVSVLDLRYVGVTNLSLSGDSLEVHGHMPSVPLVEGEYRVGLWVVTNMYQGNHLDLAAFQVAGASAKNDLIPLPASVRGYVEIPFSGEVTRPDTASSLQP